jgi:hypothetical protein
VTYEELVQIALTKPETNESTSYRRPSVKRKDWFMFCLREDEESVAIKLPWVVREDLLARDPETFFLNAHYEGWSGVLVRLSNMREDVAQELVEISWEDAPKAAQSPPSLVTSVSSAEVS